MIFSPSPSLFKAFIKQMMESQEYQVFLFNSSLPFKAVKAGSRNQCNFCLCLDFRELLKQSVSSYQKLSPRWCSLYSEPVCIHLPQHFINHTGEGCCGGSWLKFCPFSGLNWGLTVWYLCRTSPCGAGSALGALGAQPMVLTLLTPSH